MLDSSRLVFVAGLHRSGTTPLARTLAEHPQISGLSDTGVKENEGQHLQDVYPPARTYGGPGRFALDDRAHLTEHSPLGTEANAARILTAWLPHWDLERRYLLEKSPPNLLMTRFLQELYPQSTFVVVLRHPLVVALSTVKWRRLLSRNWQNHLSVEDMVHHWLYAHDIFLSDLAQVRRVHVLRYEDLVADPDSSLEAIGALLGVETPIPAAGIRASHSERYEQDWQQMASSLLHRREYRRIVERQGPQLARYGYDVDDLRHREPLVVPSLTSR